ncbi:MAG: Gfo/Idh/MocA family oxidoreductase [Acidobacteriota bacterium]|nr:MAG: Gfo/Idh/MocA family oxidoreductase [Acidobacteriota bacterium]
MNLTPEKKELGRRNFIKAVAATPVAGALVWKASSMTPVRAGIVGIGGQGGVLLENAPPSHIRISAVCDIFPDNRERALKIAQERHDPNAKAYSNLEDMLNQRDLEAIIIATPLWMHGEMSVAALNAGKHVFCEKNMAKGIDECRQMLDAAKAARRNLQIGHQRNYNPLYHQAKQMIDSGTIGDIYHVRTLWHRNNSWRRTVPETDFDPTPWGYEDLEHYKNWRLYKKFSLGLMAELASHQIQIVNWFSGRLPERVFGTGGTHLYKDGREIPDHVYLMYDYPDGLTLTFSSIQSNAWDHYYEVYFGTKGTILLSGEREAMLFYEGGHEPSELKVENVQGDAPVMQASESRARDAAGTAVSGGAAGGFNALTAYRLELEGFAQTIRDGRPNLCDGVEGMNAAIATIMGYDAVEKQIRNDIRPDIYPSSNLS